MTNKAEVAEALKQIELAQRDLRELEYPWLKSLRRMAELLEELAEIDLRRHRRREIEQRRQPAKAPQKPKLPYSIKQERRSPNGWLILNRYEKGEPGYEQEQAEIHQEWLAERRAKGYRDF